MTCTTQKLRCRDQNKNNEVDRACGTNGREDRCKQVSIGKVGEKEVTWKT